MFLNQAQNRLLNNFFSFNKQFYGLPEIHKSALISDAIARQNSEYVDILEPNDLKL